MTRSRRRLYSARTTGNSTHTSAGGGGHSGGKTARAPGCRTPREAPAALATIGSVVGHGTRSGTSGEVDQRMSGVREAMREMGISGRLIQACQGQFVGLEDRRARKRSLPMTSRTAKAP